jgi:hypothetical protein
MATSSNLVRLAYITEATYGVTPGTGNFGNARFISESFSGTPETVESAQIRTDRMSSGQIVTGLTVESGLNFELAKETALEDFMESAMYNTFSTASLVTVNLDYSSSAKTLTRASGTFVGEGLKVGDISTLSGFINAVNNVQVMVTNVTALVLTVAVPDGMVTESGAATAYKRADKLSIGTTKKSFSFEKAFTDLVTKAIIYKGMIAGQMDLNVAYGELVNGSFTFMGNNYATADLAAEFITDSRTINAQATTQTMNGSVDMPFLTTSALGSFSQDGLDIQSVSLSLNNNMTPQNVIGNTAPVDYTPGTAQISVDISAYLTDNAWAILGSKLTQTPFGLGFMVKNAGGFYGFFLPAVQVSFEDPASGGQNQDVILEMTGTAKVGASGESALVIYKG